jgi:hypothetical protein
LDVETGNLIASYDTADEALELVRDAIGRHGRQYVSTWALGTVDRSVPPVIGEALADLALRPVGS